MTTLRIIAFINDCSRATPSAGPTRLSLIAIAPFALAVLFIAYSFQGRRQGQALRPGGTSTPGTATLPFGH